MGRQTRIVVALAAIAIALTSAAPAFGGPDVLRVARRALQVATRADNQSRAVDAKAGQAGAAAAAADAKAGAADAKAAAAAAAAAGADAKAAAAGSSAGTANSAAANLRTNVRARQRPCYAPAPRARASAFAPSRSTGSPWETSTISTGSARSGWSAARSASIVIPPRR